MKLSIVLLFLLIPQLSYSQSASLTGKNWSYKKVALVYEQDTLVIFHKDSTKNIWYMGGVSLKFKTDNTYSGINVDGNSQSGTWSMPTAQIFIVDKDTTQFEQITSTTLKLSGITQYHDLGVNITGNLLTELYVTPEIITACQTRQSGDWTDPATWSCGHEPTSTDVAVINPEHVITISTNTAQAQRIIYYGGKIKFSFPGNKIFVKGVD